jgi:phage baseplate assembly protein gpV
MSCPGIAEQMGALMGHGSDLGALGGVFSLTLATVKNINDEKKLNRVRCLPIGAPDEELSDWCYVMTPMGGKERGLFLFPQVDDLVVLGYLENDPHRPIVLGGFWNSETTPPYTVADGKAEDYCLKTPQKVEFTLHDEDKKQKLTVTMPSGIVIEIDDEQQTLTTKNKDSDTMLTMKMKDGEIELTAKSKLTLTSGNASITLEKDGNITVKGSGDVTVDGKGVNVKASGQLTMKGNDIAATANKDLNLKATATASVKGTMLKLN